MKRNILSLAVAAGLTGVAGTATAAMHLNDKGLGEALVFPFYSAENGNDTYIHVVNTTGHAKAVKVRIIEGRNSQEVLDFNLYLSAEDHFAFAITESDDGEGAKLITGDKSCTAPAIPAGGVDFVNFKYSGDDNDSLARTKTGYVEVIEMGVLDATVTPGVTGKPVNYAKAVTHNDDGIPANCGAIITAWTTGGDWLTNPQTGFAASTSANTGGLYGVSTIVNPEEAYAVGVDAVAVDDLLDLAVTPAPAGKLHFAPGDEEPNFLSAGIDDESVIFVDGGEQAFNFAGQNTGLTGPALDQRDAVSSLFMSTELVNDFVLDDGRLSATDWVVTFPTKLFYVNGFTVDKVVDGKTVKVPVAQEPFSMPWDATDESCEPFALSLWDREEANVTITNGPVFSPKPPSVTSEDFVLCTEQGVLQMGERPAIGSTAGSTAVDLSENVEYAEGWARISYDPANLNKPVTGLTRTLTDGTTTLTGLPVTGFAVTKLYNSAAKEGVEAFYAASNVHKATVAVS